MYAKLPPDVKSLLWDVESKSLSIKTHASFIISRLLEKGSMQHLQWLFKTYPTKKIRNVVQSSKNLSSQTAHFWKIVLNNEAAYRNS